MSSRFQYLSNLRVVYLRVVILILSNGKYFSETKEREDQRPRLSSLEDQRPSDKKKRRIRTLRKSENRLEIQDVRTDRYLEPNTSLFGCCSALEKTVCQWRFQYKLL